jgi:predicted DNA-binding transcriptional regulator AlpA
MRRDRREAELMTALQERVQQVSPAPALVVDVYGAMQMLRLGRCSVLAMAERGELPRLRFGRSVRFAVSDIEALVERRRKAAAQVGPYRLTPPDPAGLPARGRGDLRHERGADDRRRRGGMP